MSDAVILLGGGGHAKVVMDCLRAAGTRILGILDDRLATGSTVLGVPVLGALRDHEKYAEHPFLIAIGDNGARQRIAEELPLRWITAIHPSACVSPYAAVGCGTVIMPRAVVNAGAVIGAHCIINTGAIAEHDDRLEDYVHLSPASALGGTVSVGRGTHIGIGAVVRNNTRICGGCVIGGGAVVAADITEAGTYVGVPARRLR